MIIEGYTGWAAHVNKVILDSSTIDVGEDNKQSSSTEGGGKRLFTSGFFVPDRYTVNMEFSWEDDEFTPIDGENEYTRFIKWYKYVHRYGTVPFEFPQILYSPETGIKVQDDASDNYKVEYYKITSKLPGKKVGTKMAVTMTWETVFFGVIDLDKDNWKDTYAGLNVANGYIDVAFSQVGMTEPVSGYFSLYLKKTGEEYLQTPIIGFRFDNNVARIYFEKQSTGGDVTFSYSSDTLTIKKGTYSGSFA